MAKRVHADVNPNVLIWARKSAGMDLPQAAKKVDLEPEELNQIEVGDIKPTLSQLRKLAEAYRRPLAALLFKEPPKEFDVIHDYRRLPGATGYPQDPALAYEIRRAHFRREVAEELVKELAIELPTLPTIDLEEGPEKGASLIRKWLQVSSGTHSEWQNTDDAFRHWRRIVESKGVLVFQMGKIDVETARGFSISERPLPVVVVNSKDSGSAKIFTLMHELAHVLLGESGVCDTQIDPDLSPEERVVEVFCNHVAGAVLLPSMDYLPARKVGETLYDYARRTATQMRVSSEVVLRRMLIFRRISESDYRRTVEQIRTAPRRPAKPAGQIPEYIKALSRTGRLYSRIVLSSYNADRITGADFVEYLDLKLKHLPKLVDALRPNAKPEGGAAFDV